MAHRIIKRREAGFTIIEIMLFLAITGALIAALLGGVGIALNNQRYIDSTQTFKSFLQGQFSDLDTIINNRPSNVTCDSNAVATPSGSSTTARGQSDCFIVGSYVTIVKGTTTTTDVIATQKSGNPGGGTDDVAKLAANYNFNLATDTTQTQELEWGTEIAWPASGASTHDSSQTNTTPRSFVMLIVRSPDSGAIYTFTADPTTTNQTDPTKVQASDILAIMKGGNVVPGQGDRLICLESNGLSTSGNTGFYISAYASNAAAIQTRSNDGTTQIGGTAQC